MRDIYIRMETAARSAWRFLREWSGDDAYERYLAHVKSCAAHGAPLDRREFFRLATEQRWNGINRCC